MPKICQSENCNNRVFSNNFCRWHQHLNPKRKVIQLKRSPVKKQSDKLTAALKIYVKDKKVFMKENPFCAMPGCSKHSTDLHHMKGRGKYLLAKEYWKALCRSCHDWATENSKAAIEMGVSVSRLNKAS